MEQYTWMILYSLCMFIFNNGCYQGCWRIGLTHGASIHEWYYIVYVSLFSIMDVIKYVEEVGLNHGAIIHGYM